MRQPDEIVPATDKSSPRTQEALQPYEWEGDDDHVIFWMLSLTPTERVEFAQGIVDGVLMLRHGLQS
jgi:hypothetical protein